MRERETESEKIGFLFPFLILRRLVLKKKGLRCCLGACHEGCILLLSHKMTHLTHTQRKNRGDRLPVGELNFWDSIMQQI